AVTVGSTVLSPRLAIGSVPYALRADHANIADHASGADSLGGLGVNDLQRKLTPATCGAGSSLNSLRADGTFACAATPSYAASCPVGQAVIGRAANGAAWGGSAPGTPLHLIARKGRCA